MTVTAIETENQKQYSKKNFSTIVRVVSNCKYKLKFLKYIIFLKKLTLFYNYKRMDTKDEEMFKCAEIFRIKLNNKYLLICSQCNERFTIFKELLYHIESHFMDAETNEEKLNENDNKNENENKNENDTFIDGGDTWIDQSIKLEVLSVPNSAVQNTSIEKPPEPFECDICKKTFDSKFQMIGHIKAHGQLLVCDNCNKSFRYEYHLNRHRMVCDGVKVFSCTLCTRFFSEEKQMKRHMSYMHQISSKTNNKYKCDKCDFETNSSRALTKHLRTHLSERPYQCSICAKSFHTPSYLKIHMRFHTGERPFQCAECGKGFVSNSILMCHIQTHGEKNIKCDLCDLKFHSNYDVNQHRRKHTGERPYACPICSKTFTTAKILRQHKELHNIEKKRKCRHCDMSFAQTAGRRFHERSVHHSAIKCKKNY